MARHKTFCTIEGCNGPCVGRGYCIKHYKRWYKYGDPTKMLRIYKHENPVCRVSECNLPTLAKGLCMNHYALNKHNGAPITVKKYVGWYIKDGYRYVHVGNRHYEPEHRVVMEKFLGRKLLPEEQVHHIDNNPLNNSIGNLQILSRSEHALIHKLGHINGHTDR